MLAFSKSLIKVTLNVNVSNPIPLRLGRYLVFLAWFCSWTLPFTPVSCLHLPRPPYVCWHGPWWLPVRSVRPEPNAHSLVLIEVTVFPKQTSPVEVERDYVAPYPSILIQPLPKAITRKRYLQRFDGVLLHAKPNPSLDEAVCSTNAAKKNLSQRVCGTDAGAAVNFSGQIPSTLQFENSYSASGSGAERIDGECFHISGAKLIWDERVTCRGKTSDDGMCCWVHT